MIVKSGPIIMLLVAFLCKNKDVICGMCTIRACAQLMKKWAHNYSFLLAMAKNMSRYMLMD